MTVYPFDFNGDTAADLIPDGTKVKVTMKIRPGGYNDAEAGWTGDWAKQGKEGAVYLDIELTVLEGEYAKRNIWTMIGLSSPKGPTWQNMGRGRIRQILGSARGISNEDESPKAQEGRRIKGFGDLDGLTFAIIVGIEKDQKGDPKNTLKAVIGPDDGDYVELMGISSAPSPQSAQGRPSWMRAT
jgi:hypothetical protein